MGIRKQVMTGVVWTAINKYSGIIIQLLVSMVLARLLTPRDFGVMGIANVIIAFFNIFSEMGISVSIIQRKDLSKHDLNSIFTFTVYIGLFLSLLFCGVAYIIADFYEEQTLCPLCQVLSLNLFFASIRIVPEALLLKDKAFRFVAVRNLSIQVLLGFVSVVLAFLGCGIWTLLINPVVGTLLNLLINLKARPVKFLFKLDIRPIKSIASYSLYQLGFNTVNYFTRNLDNLLTGKFIGLNQLGYYQKSYQMMLLPVQNITNVISPVLHPILSDYQNDLEFIKEKFLKLIKLLAAIGFPVSVILFFMSEELILLFFGNQWRDAVPTFRILTLTVGMQIIGCNFGPIFQAANSTKLLFILGIINSSTYVLLLIVGLVFIGTIEGVAWALVASTVISIFVNWPYLFHFVFHSSVKPAAIVMLPGLMISSILIAILLLPLSFVVLGLPIIASFFIKGIVSLIALVVLLHAFHILNMKKVIIKVTGKIQSKVL